MTLIFARKQGDSIEICADKRITYGSGEYHDSCCKIRRMGNFIYAGAGDLLIDSILASNPLPDEINLLDEGAIYEWARTVRTLAGEYNPDPQYEIIIISADISLECFVHIDRGCNVQYFKECIIGTGSHIADFMVSCGMDAEMIFSYVSSRIASVSSTYDQIVISPCSIDKIKDAVQKKKKKNKRAG